jgi:hypothetical protein
MDNMQVKVAPATIVKPTAILNQKSELTTSTSFTFVVGCSSQCILYYRISMDALAAVTDINKIKVNGD